MRRAGAGLEQLEVGCCGQHQCMSPLLERKPSPEAIEYLMEKYKIKPEEAIMIGDRELDILSGKNAGIHTCFFDDQGGICNLADYNIKDYHQLYEIIDDNLLI